MISEKKIYPRTGDNQARKTVSHKMMACSMYDDGGMIQDER